MEGKSWQRKKERKKERKNKKLVVNTRKERVNVVK